MFVEHIPQKHVPERWIVKFTTEDHPQLFERYNARVAFVTPVANWLDIQATNTTIQITPTESFDHVIPSDPGTGKKETRIEVSFFKKSEAEHFLARFFHG
jgi:hypothetical protein